MVGRIRKSEVNFPPLPAVRDGSVWRGARSRFGALFAGAETAPRLQDREIPAPRYARATVITVLCGYTGILILNVLWENPTPGKLVLFVLCVLVTFSVQLLHTSPKARTWPPRRKAVSLSIQAVLTFLPLLWFDVFWGSMCGILAGAFLLLVPRPWAWVLYGTAIISIMLATVALGRPLISVLYVPASSALTGLLIFGVTRLAELVAEVHASRAELARMAVAQERLRFSRDLHDLLGYSLSTITLKSELIYRLVPARPDRAREEIASVLQVSRQALSDVRLVASGYRDMSLEAEARSAASILSTADVRATVDVSCGRLHPVVDTVLATVLREGITNILRHSKVQVCTIAAALEGETVRLTLVNDGVEHGSPPSPHSGSGIGNLHTRLTAIGGRVHAGVKEDGLFHLVAEAPAKPVVVPSPSDEPVARPAA
ncbi:sensor histidine kinase [Streptomyces sp. URMC 123]|uniref:sensor histidine kinase n=1 Tax=Streptomyces sp. URMC 123 TaxID=3423403 RepID=UPI003F19C2C1